MSRRSIVVLDVIWEFGMSKQNKISTETARGSLISTGVSKKNQSKADGCFCLNFISKICI